jgi:hypothetical protein
MSVSLKTIEVTKVSDFLLRHLSLESNYDVKRDRNLGQLAFTVKKTFELCTEYVLP